MYFYNILFCQLILSAECSTRKENCRLYSSQSTPKPSELLFNIKENLKDRYLIKSEEKRILESIFFCASVSSLQMKCFLNEELSEIIRDKQSRYFFSSFENFFASEYNIYNSNIEFLNEFINYSLKNKCSDKENEIKKFNRFRILKGCFDKNNPTKILSEFKMNINDMVNTDKNISSNHNELNLKLVKSPEFFIIHDENFKRNDFIKFRGIFDNEISKYCFKPGLLFKNHFSDLLNNKFNNLKIKIMDILFDTNNLIKRNVENNVFQYKYDDIIVYLRKRLHKVLKNYNTAVLETPELHNPIYLNYVLDFIENVGKMRWDEYISQLHSISLKRDTKFIVICSSSDISDVLNNFLLKESKKDIIKSFCFKFIDYCEYYEPMLSNKEETQPKISENICENDISNIIPAKNPKISYNIIEIYHEDMKLADKTISFIQNFPDHTVFSFKNYKIIIDIKSKFTKFSNSDNIFILDFEFSDPNQQRESFCFEIIYDKHDFKTRMKLNIKKNNKIMTNIIFLDLIIAQIENFISNSCLLNIFIDTSNVIDLRTDWHIYNHYRPFENFFKSKVFLGLSDRCHILKEVVYSLTSMKFKNFFLNQRYVIKNNGLNTRNFCFDYENETFILDLTQSIYHEKICNNQGKVLEKFEAKKLVTKSTLDLFLEFICVKDDKIKIPIIFRAVIKDLIYKTVIVKNIKSILKQCIKKCKKIILKNKLSCEHIQFLDFLYNIKPIFPVYHSGIPIQRIMLSSETKSVKINQIIEVLLNDFTYLSYDIYSLRNKKNLTNSELDKIIGKIKEILVSELKRENIEKKLYLKCNSLIEFGFSFEKNPKYDLKLQKKLLNDLRKGSKISNSDFITTKVKKIY